MRNFRKTAALAAAIAATTAAASGARADDGEAFSLSTLSVADRLLYIQNEDLDDDGLQDILIVHNKGLHPDRTRWLSIFWQRGGGFSTAADQSWEIDSLAVALDTGDVEGDGRKEIVFLTGEGVSYYRLEEGRYSDSSSELFATGGLMGLYPSKITVPYIDFVRDWDGDGREEVAVFKFEGLSIFHRDSTGVYSVENQLEMELRTSVGRISSEGDREQTPGLWASYSFPSMKLVDFNGDGLDDLYATRRDRLRIYAMGDDGLFERSPVVDRVFDVMTQKEKIQGIANIDVIVHDLTADGHGDAVVIKQTAKGLSNFRGVISVFRGGAGGYGERPDQVIISEGTASAQSFIMDLNGDERMDLVLPSVKISISAIIRFLVTRSVPIYFNIFLLGEDGDFSERPDFTKEVKFKIDFSGDSDTQAMDIGGDYNGDGIKDFVFATEEDELSVFLGETGDDDRLFSRKPAVEIEADAFGDLIGTDLDDDGFSDMIIYYPQSSDKKGRVQVLMNLRRL